MSGTRRSESSGPPAGWVVAPGTSTSWPTSSGHSAVPSGRSTSPGARRRAISGPRSGSSCSSSPPERGAISVRWTLPSSDCRCRSSTPRGVTRGAPGCSTPTPTTSWSPAGSRSPCSGSCTRTTPTPTGRPTRPPGSPSSPGTSSPASTTTG
ncbi:hypothetical protein Ae150APs1_6282 [Pseudonocardia sp. Ae150A_Ps1]|nr:hypothetical protein Ae150APs1_6282 [Pseudonocardia sp. Ae150A_Ps1]